MADTLPKGCFTSGSCMQLKNKLSCKNRHLWFAAITNAHKLPYIILSHLFVSFYSPTATKCAYVCFFNPFLYSLLKIRLEIFVLETLLPAFESSLHLQKESPPAVCSSCSPADMGLCRPSGELLWPVKLCLQKLGPGSWSRLLLQPQRRGDRRAPPPFFVVHSTP